MTDPVRFVDTTVRDGQASLWAMNMRTRHMLPAMPHLDAAGFEAMEFLATGSRLKKFVRHLKENPWHWIRQGAAAAEHTPLRWHGPIDGPSMSGFVVPEVGELLIAKAVELGIRHTRTGNNWNDFVRLADQLPRFERLGMTPVVNLMYSISPKHTDDYYVTKAREAGELRPWRLCFKDVSGLLTPERTRTLLPRLMAAAGDVPWEFHGHCTNGLGPLNALEAVKAGVRYVHTAVPPLANATSQPSIVNVATNIRALGYRADVDLDALAPASEHLLRVARAEDLPIGTPYEYDEELYRHQVPGGMRSNLEYQLAQAGMADRLDEVLEEIPRVRADFGYPIMVTPLSQYVGSQATLNVIAGERYAHVTDRSIEYALGRHGGDEAVDGMDPDVRDRILGRPRAAELRSRETPRVGLADLRARYGRTVCDEDLILMSIVGDDAVDLVGSADSPYRPEATTTPLIALLEGLARERRATVSVRRPGLSVTVQTRPTARRETSNRSARVDRP